MACPYLLVFAHPVGSITDILWGEQLVFLQAFGLLAGSTSRAFRRLIRRQHRTKDLFVQAQMMEATGRPTGGVALDLNNMLMAIAGYSHLPSLRIQPTGENKKLCDRRPTKSGQMLGIADAPAPRDKS